MATWVKVLLILGSLLLVFFILIVGVGWWAVKNAGRLQEIAERARKEGKAFAAKTDADGCINEALARLDSHQDVIGSVGESFFLRACLDAAPRPADFCDAVPKRDEYMKSSNWVEAECTRRKHSKSTLCSAFMQEVQDFCWPRKRDATSAEPRR